MKIKLIIDVLNEESFEIISYFSEYKKTHPNLDLDIHGINLTEDYDINRVYHGLYYSNKFGVGLEYLQSVLSAFYVDKKDIRDLKVLADCFKAIGYDKDDFIDAMMEGDYEEMHDYLQNRYQSENICAACTGLIYDDNTQVFTKASDIKDFMDNIGK